MSGADMPGPRAEIGALAGRNRGPAPFDVSSSFGREGLDGGPSDAPQRPLRLAVDAMGGDHGPAVAIEGLARLVGRDPESDAPPPPEDAEFLIFGASADLDALLAKAEPLAGRARVEACAQTVAMTARPAEALRSGRDSSMWRAIDAVASGEADAALSMGNTGALMTMATVRLRTAPHVGRPAIAALWPSIGPAGATVMLDMGADLRADEAQLTEYAVMGVEYARIALAAARPRVGLLNVGVEHTKGRAELRAAADRLEALCAARPGLDAEFVGFVEGDRIAFGDADVIVTDGFTGNIALKTAEGVARLVRGFVRDAFSGSPAGRVAALLARPALKRLSHKLDPRRVNGGVFLGLNGVVVKSHGGADAVGFESAAALALDVARRGVPARIASQVAKLEPAHVQRADGSLGKAAGS